MNPLDYVTVLFPRTVKYRMCRKKYRYIEPTVLTFSITAACQSKCKTCRIGSLWCADPTRSQADLTIDEIERSFRSIGTVYYFNVSGGEPYLRKDFPAIIELACRYLKPKVIVIPTNGIMSEHIYEDTCHILEIIQRYDPRISISIHPSIDGIGEKHDEIRGVKGNFDKMMRTIELLKPLEKLYRNFTIEPGTVVSNFNINDIDEISSYVRELGLVGHRNEIAEQRSEFFNVGDPITPSPEKYQELMKKWAKDIEDNIKGKPMSTKVADAMRLVYCQIAGKILETHKRVIPCYAGILHIQINYNGGVWGCCVLGYDHEFGNLRDFDYNLPKLLSSPKALQEWKYIQSQQCACPLAGVIGPSMLCHMPSMFKAGAKFIKFMLKG